jgi:hypothetical protein
MKNSDARVNGWSQSHLLPPEHLRIVLTVHVAATATSAQVGVLVKDHGEDITLGIYTTSVKLDTAYDFLCDAVNDLLVSALNEHHVPF